MNVRRFLITTFSSLFCATALFAEPVVQSERLVGKAASPQFQFTKVPTISDDDTGQDATVEIVDGQDEYYTRVRVLNDGGGPKHSWDGHRMYSFAQGSGRVRMDLGAVQPISRVNSFSWNEGDRAPQFYTLYASDGKSDRFVPAPRRGMNPLEAGWVKIADVDTRPQAYPLKDNGGGQYGVSIADPNGDLGQFRYLLWDIQSNIPTARTACAYSELDVVVAGIAGKSRKGVISTTDQKSVEGQARLEGDHLFIRDGAGKESSWTIDQVKSAAFTALPPALPAITGEAAIANGLRGEYFDGHDLKDPKLVRYDPAIAFNWMTASPDPLLGQNYSVRWTGQIGTLISADHTFMLLYEGGVRLWIDGHQLIDQWNDLKLGRHEAKINLLAGRKYDLKLECRGTVDPKHGERGKMQLRWSFGNTGSQPIVSERFFPPPSNASEAVRVRIMRPVSGEWFVAPAPVPLQAKINGSGANSAKVDFYSQGKLIGSGPGPDFKFNWIGAPAGMHDMTARLIDGNGVALSSPVARLSVANQGDGSIPTPWGAMPIGSKDEKPAAYAGGAFTLVSKAGILHAQSDICAFVAQPIDGDGQITCRVNAFPKDQFGYAGLMLRESLAGDAPSISLTVGVDVARFSYRSDRAGYVTVNPLNRAAPCYLRLRRRGASIAAYLSDDGTRWLQVYSRDITGLPRRLFVGLTAVGNSEDTPLTATLNHVELITKLPKENEAIGVLTCAGSFLAGEVHKGTSQQIWVDRWSGAELPLQVTDVARIIFHPVPAEINSIEPGHTGVVLNNGDFFEGEFREITDNRLNLESVLFGRKSFTMVDHSLLAAVLHDATPMPHDQVRTRDGSVLMAKSIKIEGGRLLVDDESSGVISLSLRSIESIERK